MKKYKYISLSVILILIFTLIIALFKPIIIADMLYKFNANDLALKMYQRQYDKTTDTRSLKGINLSWHESKNRSKDSEWAEYALQVLEQEEYYSQTDKEFLDKICTRYLNYVYFSGDIDDFIKNYHEHIEKIEDNIFFKLSFVLLINNRSDLREDVYMFAIKESLKIIDEEISLENEDSIQHVTIAYGSLFELYQKIGADELAAYYFDELKKFLNELYEREKE